jgi:hypothetical protein
MFLNDGRHGTQTIVNTKTLARMQRPATSLAARGGLGYGLGIYQFQHGGVSFFGHGGDADGYLAHFAYAPRLQRGYFIVINAFKRGTLRKMRRIIEDAIVAGTDVATPPEVSLDAAQAALLGGTYRRVTRRFTSNEPLDSVTVVRENGKLITSREPGRRRALRAVTPWHFRRPDQTVATIAFTACGNRLYLQGASRPCPGDYAVTTQRTPVPPRPQ